MIQPKRNFKETNLGLAFEISVLIIPRREIAASWKWEFFIFSLLVYLSFSCQGVKSGEDRAIVGYELDTVMIDSKDRILDLRMNLMFSDLGPTEKSLLNFNQFDLSIDEIDLDQLAFVKTYPLEAEGPNGVGPMIVGLQALNDSLFFTKSFVISTISNKKGQVKERIFWEEAKDANGDLLEQFPRRYELVAGTSNEKIAALSFDIQKKKIYLDILSIKDGTVKRLDGDPENSYSDFFLSFDDQVNFQDPAVRLSGSTDYILVSHEYSNEIILFDSEGEFVKVVHYEPKLTPARADIPAGPAFKSRDQIQNEYKHLLEQVRFGPLVWDTENKRYFRLSAQKIFEETREQSSEQTKTTSRTNVFLAVLDADFNLISEMELPEMLDEQVKYFAKDGSLWVAQNFSDELGFLVFEFE